MSSCPCCSGNELSACCGPYLAGEAQAPTARALMRSRYSAFATGNLDYLRETLAPENRYTFDERGVRNWMRTSTWTGLEILDHDAGEMGDSEGTVTFAARFEQGGVAHEHRERSTFRFEDGRWFYVDGDILKGEPMRRATPKVGRNEPCPCGSGKKYKKCCG